MVQVNNCVVFSVLCTSPNKFTVIDPEGVIAPQSCIDIVVRYTQPSLAHCNTTEKFRITMYDRNTQQVRFLILLLWYLFKINHCIGLDMLIWISSDISKIPRYIYEVLKSNLNIFQALGKRDIPTKLIEGEPLNTTQESFGDNFHPITTKTQVIRPTEEHGKIACNHPSHHRYIKLYFLSFCTC